MPSTLQKVINTFMELGVGQDVLNTKIDHVTIVPGLSHDLASHDISHDHFYSRKLLLCRVTLGKPVEQFAATRIAHAPPGHHSVIGRPSAGGLNYPEYVIYRGEQVCDLLQHRN